MMLIREKMIKEKQLKRGREREGEVGGGERERKVDKEEDKAVDLVAKTNLLYTDRLKS
jgi:hypothetical protein